MCGPPALGLGEWLTSPQRKNNSLLRNVMQGLGIERSVVKTVTKLRDPKKAGIFLTS
jgi:hypothetical protein